MLRRYIEQGREHDLRGTERVCEVCESAPGYMLTECSGTVLSAYQKGKVSQNRLDFKAGRWVYKAPAPRFIGTFDEVTAFLRAELAG